MMKLRWMASSAVPRLVALAMLGAATLVLAESPYERNQREQLERYQQQHGLSAGQLQIQRWQQQWREQHPGEPLPTLGALEKLHRDEIIRNTNEGMEKGRQARQAELRREYLLSRHHQEQILAAQHVTWTAAQWQDWDRKYDDAQRQKANDYLRGVAAAGEMSRTEAAREEQERIRRSGN